MIDGASRLRTVRRVAAPASATLGAMPERELPRVLLFDLDDTLLAFSAGRDLWPDAYRAQTREQPPVTVEAFHAAIQRVAPLFWADRERATRGRLDLIWARRQVVALAFAELALDAPELALAVADDFTWRKEAAVALFDGALDVLEELRRRGVKLGLVTNGNAAFQRRKLERFALESFFGAILIESEWRAGKPDPSIFREALLRLDATAGDAWMVGDNLEADVAGAKAAGLRAVWNDHARTGLPGAAPATPDLVIHHVRELLPCFERHGLITS